MTRTIRLFDNSGTGQFTERIISNTASVTLAVDAGDIDGDGDLDVVTSNYSATSVVWYENDGTPGGSGTWTPHTVDAAVGKPWDVEVADIDGDGDNDVIGMSRTDHNAF